MDTNTNYGSNSLLNVMPDKKNPHCDGVNNVAIGISSLTNNVKGANNTAVGAYSLFSNNGYENVAIGANSLFNNVDGSYNVAVGSATLRLNKANSNTAIGSNAMERNIDGYSNVALGTQSLYFNDSGISNVGVGIYSLFYNTSGNFNVAIGMSSLNNSFTSCYNVAIGYESLYSNNNGFYNTAVGTYALYNYASGNISSSGDCGCTTTDVKLLNYNTAIGYCAGFYDEVGSYNTYLGSKTGQTSNKKTYHYSTAIGYNSSITGSYQMVLGDISTNVFVPKALSINCYTGNSNTGNSLDVFGNTCIIGILDVSGGTINNGFFKNIGKVDISGNVDVTGQVDISGNVDVSGNVDINGNLTLGNIDNNHSIIGSSLSIKSYLSIYNPNDINSQDSLLNVWGGCIIYRDLDISGNVNIDQNLIINKGDIYVNDGNVIIQNDLTVNGRSYLGGLNISGDTDFTRNVTMEQDLNVDGSLNVYGNIYNYGNTDISNNLTVFKNTNLYGNTDISSNLLVKGSTNIYGNADISSNLHVVGNTNLLSNLTVIKNVDVSGNTDISGNLTVIGLSTFNKTLFEGDMSVNGSLSIANNLNVSNNTDISGCLTVYKNIDVSGNVDISGNAFIYNNLNVNNDVGVTGQLTIGLSAVSPSFILVEGTSTIDDINPAPLTIPIIPLYTPISSISKDTGALVVYGGIGVSEDINVGGNISCNNNIDNSGNITTVGSITANGLIYANSGIKVIGDVDVNGNVNAFNLTALNGNVNGTYFNVRKDIIAYGNIYAHDASLNDVSGNNFYGHLLNISDSDTNPGIIYTDLLTAYGSISGYKDITATNNGTITGNNLVCTTGNITAGVSPGVIINAAKQSISCKTVSISDTLYANNIDVSGNLDVSGNELLAGILTIENTTVSTNNSSGALVVYGGIGTSGNLNVSGTNTNLTSTLTVYTNVQSIKTDCTCCYPGRELSFNIDVSTCLYDYLVPKTITNDVSKNYLYGYKQGIDQVIYWNDEIGSLNDSNIGLLMQPFGSTNSSLRLDNSGCILTGYLNTYGYTTFRGGSSTNTITICGTSVYEPSNSWYGSFLKIISEFSLVHILPDPSVSDGYTSKIGDGAYLTVWNNTSNKQTLKSSKFFYGCIENSGLSYTFDMCGNSIATLRNDGQYWIFLSYQLIGSTFVDTKSNQTVGGIKTFTNNLIISNTDDTNNTYGSGALQVFGGVGIAKSVFISKNLNVGGNTNINGIVKISNVTPSINSTSGALQVSGGVGVQGSLVMDGSCNITNSSGLYIQGTSNTSVSFESTNLTSSNPLINFYNSSTISPTTPISSIDCNYDKSQGISYYKINFFQSLGETLPILQIDNYGNSTPNVTSASTYFRVRNANAVFDNSLVIGTYLNTGTNINCGGSLVVTGNITSTGNLSVSGNIKSGGNLDVSGNIFGTNMNLTGNITANSIATPNGPLTGKSLNINSGSATIDSTGIISGTSLNVSGGIKSGSSIIGTSLNVGTGTISGGSITGTSLNVGTGNISGGSITGTSLSVSSITGTSLSVGSCSLTSSGTISGTSLSLGVGSIIAGSITGTSLNAGTGTISGGTISGDTVNVTNTCSATLFNATSDYRLKENVENLDDSFKIDNLRPVKYTLKESKLETIGFIAHELQKEIPCLVTGDKDGKDFQSINYLGLISVLVKEMQEYKERIQQLEQKVEELLQK